MKHKYLLLCSRRARQRHLSRLQASSSSLHLATPCRRGDARASCRGRSPEGVARPTKVKSERSKDPIDALDEAKPLLDSLAREGIHRAELIVREFRREREGGKRREGGC